MSLKGYDVIRLQLGPGEEILWEAQPVTGIQLYRSDLLWIPFSLAWGLFVFGLWAMGWFESEIGYYFQYVFYGFFFYLFLGRFFIDSWSRSHTYYALTNWRLIVVCGSGASNVQVFDLGELDDMSVVPVRHGVGNIFWGSVHPLSEWIRNIPWPGLRNFEDPNLIMIDDVKQVAVKIIDAKFYLKHGDKLRPLLPPSTIGPPSLFSSVSEEIVEKLTQKNKGL